MNNKNGGEENMKSIILVIGLILITGFFYFIFFKRKKDNLYNRTLPKSKEISLEEIAEIDKFIDQYEKFAKYKISSLLANRLMLPVDFIEIIEKKYPRPTEKIPVLNTSIVHLDEEYTNEYILDIAKKKFNISSLEELLKYDYEKNSSSFAALKNLIKEKVFNDILKEIEPYVPDEEKELYKKYKEGKEKISFNF